jgi:iron complex transport system ATP-binding protein
LPLLYQLETKRVCEAGAEGRVFLELEHVSVARGDTVVLHDVSLKIENGEHIAILGPNGCGKSTLIKTITREVYPIVSVGMRCRLLGRERWDISQLRRHLGVVSADLPGERTPVTSGRDAVIAGFFGASALWPNLVVTSEMGERADEALALMGATHLRAKPVGQMSAGEQRRTMIARALVHKPEMLLLDEPSNALDLAAQRELRDMLRRVAQQGTGLILVTHHLADILPEIDRVMLMREGRVVADGPRGELLVAPELNALFGIELTLAERDGYIYAW